MTGPVRTTIYFHPDAIEGEGRDLVGRRSAGHSFLKGYLRTTEATEVRALVDNPKAAATFREVAKGLGETREIVTTHTRLARDFAGAGTIFYPGPGFQNDAWSRQRNGTAACSLVGLTHTVSTRRVIEGFHRLIAEPVEEWDAIICTSRAVRAVVQNQFEAETAYFRNRFGATRVPLPQLPVIPLGIEAADFAPRDGARGRFRAAHGVPEDAVVVMSMGRLSVIEKANPLPMLMALERAAEETGREVHLWIAGWTNRSDEEALHAEAIAALCRRVKARVLDGRAADVRRDIWAAADIFSLPADSIQETFGLVPVEAMAAGLPVVMPDWDGFRDTVRHGETGFLIPTTMGAPGMGSEIAARFADGRDGYLQFLALVQSQIVIDVPAYAQAFAALIGNDDLRARMGAAGRAHVVASLDWSAVMPRYLDLARHLQERRTGAQSSTPPLSRLVPSPLEADPFALYRAYPSRSIRSGDRIALSGAVPDIATLDRIERLSGRDLYSRHAASTQNLLEFAARVAELTEPVGPVRLDDAALVRGHSKVQVATMALILAKADLVRIFPAPNDDVTGDPAPGRAPEPT